MSEKTKRGLEISITAVFVLALLLVGAVLVFSGGTASAKQFATLRLLGGQVAVQRRQRRIRDGRGWHVAPRRRYRSNRSRWASIDRILRREPHPPRLRHVVHARDARDLGERGSLEGDREQSGRWQLLSSRGGARRRPEPLRDRDADDDRIGPRHRVRAAGERWIHHDRGGERGGDREGSDHVRGRSRGQDGGRRNWRHRWADPRDPSGTARQRLAQLQPMRPDDATGVRRGATAKQSEGPTEPHEGIRRGGVGVDSADLQLGRRR